MPQVVPEMHMWKDLIPGCWSIRNHRHTSDLWVCGCICSSTLSWVPFFLLKSLRLQLSHVFQVTSTVSKAGRGREEREGGDDDLGLTLRSSGECSEPVLVGASHPSCGQGLLNEGGPGQSSTTSHGGKDVKSKGSISNM